MESGDHRRALSFWNSTAIVLGIVIGVGIFRVPAIVAQSFSSPLWFLAAWILGGAVCLLGVLIYSELASSYPESGGNYIYLREAYGRWAGFLFAWSELWVVRSGSMAAVSYVFAEHFLSLTSLNPLYLKVVAIALVLLLALANMAGTRHGARTQSFFAFMVVCVLLLAVLFGFAAEKGDFSHFDLMREAGQSRPAKGGLLQSMFLALIPILWTYGGWHENTFLSGETREPSRTVPRALLTGILIVIGVYLLINGLYVYLFSLEGIARSELIMSDSMRVLFGKHGQRLFEVFVMMTSIASVNGMIMAGSRITFAMGRDQPLFRFFGEPHPRLKTPHRAIAVNALWASVLIVWGTFDQLLFFTGAVVWLFFSLVVGGLFILRRKFPDRSRPYRAWGGPATGILFLLVCLSLVVNTVWSYPAESLVGFLLVISGLPLYAISERRFELR